MTFLTKSKIGIPQLGFGSGTVYFQGPTPTAPPNEELIKMQINAVENGFIHLDSAECYGNDRELKQSLNTLFKSGVVGREDLFITEKYFAGDGTFTYHSASINPYERIKKFLSDTDLEYADLYLLHAPFIKKESHGFDLKEAWKFMQQCQDEGLAKIIGVSNFRVEDLKEIWDSTKTNPQVNQIEFSPFLQNQTPGIYDWCKSHNVEIEAYSPLGPLTKGDLTQGAGLEFKKYIDEISAKYVKTAGQVILRWVIDKDVIPISTSTKPSRLEELKGAFGWSLEKSEVDKISQLGSKYNPVLRQYWLKEFSHYD
ncbi:aldo-keto reductase superfamily protein [Martiniozyma asiatica (nom. inval.)]|nr:aldo-keto reductase superfamily protein [Martiniozyma asiatica]